MNRTRRTHYCPRAGLYAALIYLATACGVPADDKPRPISADKVPFELLTPTSTATTGPPVETIPVTIYLLEPERLTPTVRMVAAPVSLGTLLASLIQGPSDSEAQTGLRSAVNPQTRVLNSEINGDVAVVNVGEAFSGIGVQEQILALAQLVYTATELPGVTSVQVQLNSAPAAVPRGDGTLSRVPLRRSDFPTLSPVAKPR